MSKYIMFLGFSMILLSIIFGASEKIFIGTTETTRLGLLFQPMMILAQGDFNPLSVFGSVLNGTYLQNLWALLWWDYPILNQSWFVIFRYLFMTISLGVIIGFIMNLLSSVKLNT